MRCGGAVGFLHCSEIMWQYCDQWHGVWKRGEKVSCRILHLSPAEGGLLLGHRQTVGDPFLKHTPGVGSGYPATVRRSSDESVVVLLGDTGSKPRSPRPTLKLFFTGVGQFIPQPGTTISEVTVVRIENPGDPKRRHPFVRVTLLNPQRSMDNKLHYAHTFFCSHLAAVGRASEVQAGRQAVAGGKTPDPARPTNGSAASITRVSLIRSCRSTDRPRGRSMPTRRT